MGKHTKKSNSSPEEPSRKEKRKQLRKEKKDRKRQFYNRKSLPHGASQNNFIRSSKPHLNTTKKQSTHTQQTHKVISKSNTKSIPNQANNSKQQSTKAPLVNKQTNSSKIEKLMKKRSPQEDEEILKEEKEIEYYEKLLGVNKKKGKYKTIAKGLGYEDDLFDFLDNISKKVKGPNPYNQQGNYDQGQFPQQNLEQDEQDQVEAQNQDQDQDQEESQFQDEDDEQFDQIPEEDEEYEQDQNEENMEQQNSQGFQDQQDVEQDMVQEQGQQQYSDQEHIQDMDQQDIDIDQQDLWNQLQQESIQKPKSNKQNVQTKKQPKTSQQKIQKTSQNQQLSNQQQQKRPRLFGNMTQQQKEQQQVRKQMNGLFNKLSDGNLMITFRQFSQIFLSASKSVTIPIFINLFIKSNVQVQKPHLHILLSNISLASALHHLIGNRLMAPLIHEIVMKFTQYENTPENYEEIQEIGYSRLFEKKKNIIAILSYLYDFGSITGQFIYTLVKHLALELNQQNVQFLYIIIQKIGNKIRQNDPAILKDIIQTLKSSIQNFKNSNPENQISKINIIEIELNQIKFNKKQPMFLDQRMAFFTTFLTKNVPNELNTQKQILLPNYEQIKNANTTRTNWWQNLEKNNQSSTNRNQQENEEQLQMISELTAQRKQLIQLAKSLNLVTQIRKNIFVQIMQASDYIEATQRVLALKIKNLQQISVVLLQACVLQPTFNPYYALVAAKISNINPKFKSKVQFVIWDHIKLLQSYNPRKTSNLAKFTARFVGNSLTNGSLSILKYFPDLINVHPYESMFLVIFFSELFAVTKKPTLVNLSTKLKEESNQQIKNAILEYFSEVGTRQKGFGNMEKMKFLRRMIMLNQAQDDDRERQ